MDVKCSKNSFRNATVGLIIFNEFLKNRLCKLLNSYSEIMR